MRVAVIGSGPAGWAATTKLAELGHEISVFTGDLSDRNQTFKDINLLPNRLNLKLLRGSDYPYRQFPHGPQKIQEGVNLSNSYAFSGLSLVWGATMLPYSDTDLSDWPIAATELDAGYRFVLERIPVSGRSDGLRKVYPPYFNQNPLFPTSRFLTFFESFRDGQIADFHIGSSRLAVQITSDDGKGCNYCAECLNGCPINKIWRSPEISLANVRYFKNLRVISISEADNQVSLNTLNLEGKSISFSGFDKVFIGAGNIETFRILSTSKLVPERVVNKDSATFFVPLLLSRKYGKPENAANTLSQAFVRHESEIYGASQIQLYDFSGDLMARARKALPYGRLIPNWLIKIPLRRLFVGIGYVSSAHSDAIEMYLDQTKSVVLTKIRNDKSQKDAIHSIIKELSKVRKILGVRPLFPLVQHALPGEGVHSGGWLAMGESSDLMGRPKGCSNIHVIDSSVFPNIPAGAITFTVMANAVRITEISTQ